MSIAEEAKGVVKFVVLTLFEDGYPSLETLEVDMGQDDKSFNQAWNKHIDPFFERANVIVLRQDQAEDIRDLLIDELGEGA